jgi:hypothetical protein
LDLPPAITAFTKDTLIVSAMAGVLIGFVIAMFATGFLISYPDKVGVRAEAESLINLVDFLSAGVFIFFVFMKVKLESRWATIFEGVSGGILAISTISRLFLLPLLHILLCMTLFHCSSLTIPEE